MGTSGPRQRGITTRAGGVVELYSIPTDQCILTHMSTDSVGRFAGAGRGNTRPGLLRGMMSPMPSLARISRLIPQVVSQFTTDPAVRVGFMQAAWSVAPSFARGLLPRTPAQQAIVVGINATSHYAIGATTWAGISSAVAGIPGRRAGWKALLAGAAVTGGGGFLAERALRPRSGDSMALASAWAGSKLLATTGLAGGLVMTSDVVAHRLIGRTPSVGTTLLIDVAAGCAMAGGTLFRRNLRAKRYGWVSEDRRAVDSVKGVRAYATIAGITVGTATGITALAIGEQTTARAINVGLEKVTGDELGETGIWLSHMVTGAGLAALALVGLDKVRQRTLRTNEVVEPAYPSPPTSETVSCGPNSLIEFDAIGKEGRRFVLMALHGQQITNVMGEAAVDPVRAVIPRDGTIQERAELAVAELEALGGFERSVIVVASPTGVGYVNYVMAEALEYLARGNSALVVPQYAMVPSALALDKTTEGTELQAEVLGAIAQRIRRIPPARRPRLYQFGESLGAQVALDVAAIGGVARLDSLDVTAGLYMGVPFRSRAWRTWWRNRRAIDPEGRMVLVPQPDEAPEIPGMHLMVVHDDDPVNKFAYTMFVRRPWWFGAPETRPPMVPRETLFRPISSFVIALFDLLNAMNQKPGAFARRGHDYRIDLREALQKAYRLTSSPTQAEAIENALREREQMWAEARLVAKTAYKAVATINDTLNKWGRNAVSMDFVEQEDIDIPPAWRKLMKQMSDSQLMGRLGSSGPPA